MHFCVSLISAWWFVWIFCYTVEPLYNEVLGTMKITLLYQVSHYIRVKKQRNIKSWDQQNYLVIRGFCYIRPHYNEVPLYYECSTVSNTFNVYQAFNFREIKNLFVVSARFCEIYFILQVLMYTFKHCFASITDFGFKLTYFYADFRLTLVHLMP